MTKLDERIADADRKRSLADRYGPIIEAAGYLDGTLELTPEECILLAGAIMHDKEVHRLGWAELKEGTVFCVINYVDVLESMDDDERTALRARVNYKPSKIMRGGPAR
jgi:hypothetical protein